MTTLTDLWPLAVETMQGLLGRVAPAVQQAVNEAGLGSIPTWFLLSHALNFAPEPISPTRIRQRFPYYSPDYLAGRLGNLAQAGFLQPAGDDKYNLTDKGRTAVEHIITSRTKAFASVEPIPLADAKQLTNLFGRLVKSSLESSKPASKQCLLDTTRREFPADAPALAWYVRYNGNLNAFRDDSHIAAWGKYNIPNHLWEPFTLVWRGDASTSATLHESIGAVRGHSADQCAALLRELVSGGWLEEKDGMFSVMAKGKTARDDIEKLTDEYFYESWSVLNKAEIDNVRSLHTRLRDNLKKPI